MSHGFPRRRRGLAALPFLVLPLTVAALAGPTAASAATNFTGTDAASDSKVADKALEILSADATFDATTGTAKVTVNTAETPVGRNTNFISRFGHLVGDECAPEDANGDSTDPGKVLGILAASVVEPQSLELATWSILGTDSGNLATADRSGTKTSITAGPDAALKGLSFDCVRVSSQGLTTENATTIADELVLKTGGSGSTGGGGSGGTKTSPVVVTTTQPDADKDGVPDATDQCPSVAGAAKDGCATVATKNQFKLGAKRVTFDRLVARTATLCPAKASAVVTAKGKRIGKAVVETETHGSYCYVKGVVKLKKRYAKVRLVVKGTGMGSVAKSIKR